MMLIEQALVPLSALPVQALKNHLRLGTGFAEDTLQDALLESQLRAAITAIEGRIGKALLSRRFKLVLTDWRDPTGQALPVAPVAAIVSLSLVDAAGVAEPVAAARYRLRADRHRPRLMPVGSLLPTVPTDGQVEIVFDAGFGAEWAAVPADLAQAVLQLAAQFHDHRHDEAGAPVLSAAVQSLIETWRNVRVLGGGAA